LYYLWVSLLFSLYMSFLLSSLLPFIPFFPSSFLHFFPSSFLFFFHSSSLTHTTYSPPETAWEGATLKVSIEYTEEYPVKPPVVRFQSEIFHPNVYENGEVCMDLLQKVFFSSSSLSLPISLFILLLTIDRDGVHNMIQLPYLLHYNHFFPIPILNLQRT
jgi:hypothetical protein